MIGILNQSFDFHYSTILNKTNLDMVKLTHRRYVMNFLEFDIKVSLRNCNIALSERFLVFISTKSCNVIAKLSSSWPFPVKSNLN